MVANTDNYHILSCTRSFRVFDLGNNNASGTQESHSPLCALLITLDQGSAALSTKIAKRTVFFVLFTGPLQAPVTVVRESNGRAINVLHIVQSADNEQL